MRQKPPKTQGFAGFSGKTSENPGFWGFSAKNPNFKAFPKAKSPFRGVPDPPGGGAGTLSLRRNLLQKRGFWACPGGVGKALNPALEGVFAPVCFKSEACLSKWGSALESKCIVLKRKGE